MNEQQMRKTLQDNDVEQDELEAQIDRWADERNRDRQERDYMEKQDAE